MTFEARVKKLQVFSSVSMKTVQLINCAEHDASVGSAPLTSSRRAAGKSAVLVRSTQRAFLLSA